MAKAKEGKAKASTGEVMDPVRVPPASGSQRYATTKRSAKNPLTNLTNKQEAFAQYVIQGHSQADAYRKAYDTEGMSDTSIYTEGWKLMRHPDVARRIEQMCIWMDEKQRMQAVGLQGFVQEKLLQLASDESTPKHVQVKALETLGRSVGMFVDRKETKHITDDSLPELEAKLKAKMEALKLINGDG